MEVDDTPALAVQRTSTPVFTNPQPEADGAPLCPRVLGRREKEEFGRARKAKTKTKTKTIVEHFLAVF